MQTMFDDKKALLHLDSEIVKAREAANAESAWNAANGSETANPWVNSKRRLDDLEHDRDQLALRIKGEQLTKAHEELKWLDEELVKAQVQREATDRALRERIEHETVKRYLGATSICMKFGWGHSWSAFFRPWYESGKPRYIAQNENVSFFLDSPQAREAGVQFDLGSEREAVKLYIEAMDASNKALAKWLGHAEMRANLLRERPELKAVG